MSERSKGDTSSSVAVTSASARVVKNPLLSASVTGLTFDDFQNKPLLLPAAPPIIHPVPVVSSRESTPLVTVGKSSEIDSENLSEINLNDIPGTTASSTTDISDENSNSLLEPSTQVDNSILSQAASSFSQLPSVASSVFSTFSKKFNSSSGRDDINSNPSAQLDIQPFSNQFGNQAPVQPLQPPPTAFANQEQQQGAASQSEPQQPVEPPTFYSPSDVPTVPSGVAYPPTASGQNTYRISARKKIYAPIPGLSSAHQEQNPPPTAGASFLPPIGFETAPVPVYQEQAAFNKPEERKGGLFSLSNLVPGVPNVLQNLSGLVQSAAGSLAQKSQEQPQQQPIENQFGSFQIETVGNANAPTGHYPNFFGVDQASQQPQGSQPPPPVNFFGVDPSSQQQQGSQPPPPVTFFTPPVAETVQATSIETSIPEQGQPIGNFFTPVVGPTTIATSPPLVSSGHPPQPTGILFAGLPPKSTSPDVRPTLETFPPQQLPVLPPSAKPPSGGPPSTSFRLQKGTRLYKSPFAAATSDYQPHPIGGYPSAPQSIIPLSQTTADVFSHFNPLQQGFVPPSLPERGPVSATILTPPTVSEELTPVPVSNVFQPIKATSQEDSVANISTNKPLDVSSEQPPKQASPPSEDQSAKLEIQSTIQPANASKSDIPDKQETLNAAQYPPQEQINLGQPILSLPPPPAVGSGISTPSKETANFPPPPPQHSFQNTPNSNPYRKGLQPHHLQFTAPASLSIFAPNDQDVNIFQPIAAEVVKPLSEETHLFKPIAPPISQPLPEENVNLIKPIATEAQKPQFRDINLFETVRSELGKPLPEDGNPLIEGSPSIAAFFAKVPTPDNSDNQTKVFTPTIASETSKVSAELSALILSPTESPIDKLSNVTSLLNEQTFDEADPQVNAPKATLTSDIFTPILGAPSFLPAPSASIESAAPVQFNAPLLPPHPGLVSSFFTPTSETTASIETTPSVKENTEVNRTTLIPASSLVSFFKVDSTTADPFVSAQELPFQSNTQGARKPDQSSASVPAASAKIASPPKSQENSETQQSVPNLFTSFFEPAVPTAVTPVVNQPSFPDPTSFFDSFGQVPSVGVDAPPPEDPNSQRIQNFFNNPPPKDLDPVGDLNYNLVGSGLSVKNLQTRSLTPASNLAEPPSSSCSEFSELNNSLSAANRQSRLPAEDSNKVSPEEEVVSGVPEYQDLPEEVLNEIKMANSAIDGSSNAFSVNVAYKPAVKHWFFKRKLDAKNVWTPFSFYDSALLEEAFLTGEDEPNLVAVEGGRYDVNITDRTKVPVYWEGDPIEVKRCSWFYKASDSKYVPYEEEIAELLEEEYRKASESCEWHKKIPISAGDMVVFHGPTVIVHFQQQQQVDSWGGSTLDPESFISYVQQQTTSRPRVVKRDLDDFAIEEGESHRVDHLLFMVHGIGSACDLKMRSVEEVVDEFRAIALQLVQSHYKNSVEHGYVGRVEVLPISWHSELHSDELGIDEKLKSITLESIPKLRNFTNDTLLDILFYTSPMFCQRIMNTVTASMNSVYLKYKQRHPEFYGGISMAGHSLGSLILFDLLCHQRPLKESEDQNMENPDEITPGFPVDSNKLNEDAAQHISYKMGPAGTGQPFISYPQLLFQPKKFFALGSPIGMFVTIRGIDKLGLEFRLPTCPGFYNIFHPYDPVAYRLEALVNPDMNGIPPVLIPHHKGRKRMHLELKETMTRVGADLKQRFFDTFKTTFDSVSFLAPRGKADPKDMEKEVEKVLDLQAHQEQNAPSTSRSRADSNSTNQSDNDIIEIDFPLGKLNDSKRVDYVLQEAPLEFFNEYLFALSSHVCYWESEDTILFVMKEIYSGIGFSPDSQVPQQTMTIERPSGSLTQSPTS